jgi:hypothetical protein
LIDLTDETNVISTVVVEEKDKEERDKKKEQEQEQEQQDQPPKRRATARKRTVEASFSLVLSFSPFISSPHPSFCVINASLPLSHTLAENCY